MGALAELEHGSWTRIASRLMAHGRLIGPFLPWHASSDPFDWTLAELLLRMTTRSAALAAFEELKGSYQSWVALAGTPEEELTHKIRGAGLGAQRAKQLKALAEILVNELDGTLPSSREALKKLPGVGNYAADALRLHVFGLGALPRDGNLERVFRRLAGLPLAERSRRSDPYQDRWLSGVVSQLISRYSAAELALIHRGVLDIGWRYCRIPPKSEDCPLRDLCGEHAHKARDANGSDTKGYAGP